MVSGNDQNHAHGFCGFLLRLIAIGGPWMLQPIQIRLQMTAPSRNLPRSASIDRLH